MELEQGFKSIGLRLGFESAGDYRRKLEAQNRAKDAENARLIAKIASQTTEIASRRRKSPASRRRSQPSRQVNPTNRLGIIDEPSLT